MAVKGKIPATPAVRFLKAAGIDFTPRQYNYEDRGGTETAARELGVDEHGVIKTLVFEDETGGPCLVLMHGDRQVSTKSLARNLGAKTVSTCDPAAAEKYTGYKVGGISPLGTRRKMPVYFEESMLELPLILINGGQRGWLLEMSPRDLVRLLGASPVNAAV